MEWELWSRRDEKGLARYVTPESKQSVPLKVNRVGLAPTREGALELVAAIYESLAAKGIRYSNEEYHPSRMLQRVRKPIEIVAGPLEGTCLDLAALFCGACMGYDLLPMLVVLDGHALAVVSVVCGLAEWNGYRPERELVENGPITEPQLLRDLLEGGTHIAVECTGFAQFLAANSAGGPSRRENGRLSFQDALEEGRLHIDSGEPAFRFALDIAVAHYYWRIEPFPITSVLERIERAPLSLSSLVRVQEFKTVLSRTPHFVGRESVFQSIDDAIADPQFPSGYVVLRGEPGIGKTALIAELLRRRNYVHHFNIAPENIRSPRQFLQNVCAQLIIEYRLGHNSIAEEHFNDSMLLLRLLGEARQVSANKPVVVLIDALDEAERSQERNNRLLLPRDLPEDVYFIVTMRADRHISLVVGRQRDLYLDESDPENIADVLSYIRDFIAQNVDTMTARIASWNTDTEEFSQVLLKRSEGNFMYLVYVLQDINSGRLNKETVGEIWRLPNGLREYYRQHWELLAGEGEFFEKYKRPILSLLAAVREPVDRDFIREELNLPTERIQRVLDECSQFLNPPMLGTKPMYRIYHASFQDFLREEIGLDEYVNRINDNALKKIVNWPLRV